MKQKQKNIIKSLISEFVKCEDCIIEKIEVTELNDGSGAITISFGKNWCFAAEMAMRSRFLNGSCKPHYVIGEINFGNPKHEELHSHIEAFDQDGNATPHYHFHVKKFKNVENFLTDLKHYQQQGVFSTDRNKIAMYSRANPFAFFNQMTEPKLCLTGNLIQPAQIQNFMRNNDMNEVNHDIFYDCTDGYLSNAFYAVHIAAWLLAVLVFISKVCMKSEEPTQRPRNR